MTYRVFTYVNTTEYVFSTEDKQVVINYVKETAGAHYDKVYTQNKETELISPQTRDQYITKCANDLFSFKYLYLKLISYPSVKGMYTKFVNKATSRINTVGQFYDYTYGYRTMTKLSEIPKLYEFYNRCIEKNIGSTGIYIRMLTEDSNGCDFVSAVKDKINKRAYSRPDWVDKLQSEAKIEELMHIAYLKRNRGGNMVDQINKDT